MTIQTDNEDIVYTILKFKLKGKKKEMEYIIKTENLTKKYGHSIVVDNVSIHVPKGKIYALLGRNGAGKTTLMKMLLKLISTSNGSIHLFGEKSEKINTNLFAKIGSIIEMPGFYENLSAQENMSIISRLRRQLNEEALNDSLEVVGLNNEGKKPFSNYSLGMKQRLGIAVALMHKPQLLILDEPINGLDPIGISEIRKLLSNLSKEKGVTVLISSHDLSEIEQIADVIGVMHEGQLIDEINMSELRNGNSRYIEFEISDVVKASFFLEDIHGINKYQVQGDTIKVYDNSCNCGMLNKTFVENGLIVYRIERKKENLEDYFSKLIGGGGIA